MRKKKKYSVIDDETFDKMKRYYNLENHDEIFQYLRKNNIIRGDNDRENTYYWAFSFRFAPSSSHRGPWNLDILLICHHIFYQSTFICLEIILNYRFRFPVR